MTILLGVNGLIDPDFTHGAKIKWGINADTNRQWDEIATWGIETFGLPGDRYITDLNFNHMTWWFRDPRDQTLFVLRNGMAECIELSLTT